VKVGEIARVGQPIMVMDDGCGVGQPAEGESPPRDEAPTPKLLESPPVESGCLSGNKKTC